MGESLAVTNKPGANGAVGLKELLSGNADGYTVALAVKSLFAITPLVVDDPDAVVIEDLPHHLDADAGTVCAGRPRRFALQTLEDLLGTPALNYGTAGVGTGSQLSAGAAVRARRDRRRRRPLRRRRPAITALLGKEVEAVSASFAETMPHIEAGSCGRSPMFSEERSPS